MNKHIKKLFEFLKEPGEDGVDSTQLKAWMALYDIQSSNPTLFKEINDQSLNTAFKGKINFASFREIFENVYTLDRDCEQPYSRRNNVPDLEQIANLFEFLDEDHTGMISANDFMSKLELCLKMKMAHFDYNGFVKISAAKETAEIKQKMNNLEQQVQLLIRTFDLTGDRLISPEEFFNIIMYAYTII